MTFRASGGASTSSRASDTEQQRVRIAHTLFSALALCGIAYCVVAVWLPSPLTTASLGVVATSAVLVLRALADRGHIELAVLLLLAALSVMAVLGVVLNGNIGATPMYLPVLVAVAGASLYPRQVVWSVFGVVLVLVAIHAVAAPEQVPTSASYLSLYALVVTVLVGVVSWVSARSVNQALHSAASSQSRAEQLAAELEQRVAERTQELEIALHKQEELGAELAELSFRDPLTGLYNRRRLDDELHQLFAFAKRTAAPLSVAVIDLDDFKSVNDRYTHVVGDDVLRVAAELLSSDSRASDVLVRMGGEEFALLMPNTSASDAQFVCERMRQHLATYGWSTLMPGLTVTASFGLASSTEHQTAKALVRAADERLISAKRSGKNRVEVEAIAS